MKTRFRLFFLLFSILFLSCNTNGISQESKKLALKADTALSYCKAHKMNLKYCILIDMAVHSGKNRFFVWNFKENKADFEGLVCHGMGRGSTGAVPVFSNVVNSGCTSLGKYKIGVKSYSKYGIHIHYKLHGLEKTNSNAYKRYVVLHSFDPVPEFQIYPVHLPMGMSLGCPVVSNAMMTRLDSLLSKQTRPVLLWIYK